MYYAQFYQRAVYPSGSAEIIEACSDRSVVILDGRCTKKWMGETAEAECRKRGYLAWRIFKGESFTRSAAVSPLNYVRNTQPVRNPVWLAAHD